MHPPLPEQWQSRALRVAMAAEDWTRFEALVRQTSAGATTQARALGLTISYLVHAVPEPSPEPGPLAWLDWERRKVLRLLQPVKSD